MFQNKTFFRGIMTRMIKSKIVQKLLQMFMWSVLSGYMLFNLISYRVQLEMWLSLFLGLFCLANLVISLKKL